MSEQLGITNFVEMAAFWVTALATVVIAWAAAKQVPRALRRQEATILQFVNVIRDRVAADEVRRSGVNLSDSRLRRLSAKAFVDLDERGAFHALEKIGCSGITHTAIGYPYDFDATFDGEPVAVEVTRFFTDRILIRDKERSLRLVQDDLASRDSEMLKRFYGLSNTNALNGYSFYVVHEHSMWDENDGRVFEFVMNSINKAENRNEQVSVLFNNWPQYRAEDVANILRGMRMGDSPDAPSGMFAEQLGVFERQCERLLAAPEGVSPPWALPHLAVVRCAVPGTIGRVVLDDGHGSNEPPVETTPRFREVARKKMEQVKKAESIDGKQRWLLLADVERTNFDPMEMGTEKVLDDVSDEIRYWDRIVVYDSYTSNSWKVNW